MNEKIQKLKESYMFMDKKTKLYIYLGMGFLLLVIIIAIASCALKPKFIDYVGVEDAMKSAAKNYYSKSENVLPSPNEEIVINASTLQNGGYLKEFTKYLEDGANCSGEIRVKNVDGTYLYIPYLNCGDKYFSTELYKKIAASEIVVNGDGLYKVGNELIYRGQLVNNFVSFAGQKWRIVKVTENNTVVLIVNEGNKKKMYFYDDRYNEVRKTRVGINTYELSRVRASLDEIYNDTTIFKEEDKAQLLPMALCVSNRGSLQPLSEGKIECNSVLENSNIGLLSVYDYMFASLDSGCINPSTPQCQNYNYLADSNKVSWWTLTGNADSSTHAYRIKGTGMVESVLCNTKSVARYIVTLRSDTFVRGGAGTSENPYIVKS